jgi:uncharacterized membrane protein
VGTAAAINDAGVVVGQVRGAVPRTWSAAFRWKVGDPVVTQLAGLGGSDTTARAINDAGVIVGQSTAAGDTTARAVRRPAAAPPAAPPQLL